jgi:branched-chain amino acid aminotransferase
MHRLVYCNGSIIDVGEARIAATLGGVVYGWGVFTNIRIYDGEPFCFDRHWDRLIKHAERARLEIPVSADEAAGALTSLVEGNAVQMGRARVTVLKGESGAWRSEPESKSSLLIFTAPDPERAVSELAVTLSPYRVQASGPLAGVKRTAMLENLLAFEEARTRGFTEAIMLNERGEIASATAGNIFWVEDDEVFTPSTATGCVAGVTRSLVHDIAQRINVHVVEGAYPIARLLDASEVFITSTLREITPVASFDMKRYDPHRRSVSRNIKREFKKRVRDARIAS